MRRTCSSSCAITHCSFHCGPVDTVNPGHFSLGRDTAALLSAPGDDIFLVKMAYWIGR